MVDCKDLRTREGSTVSLGARNLSPLSSEPPGMELSMRLERRSRPDDPIHCLEQCKMLMATTREHLRTWRLTPCLC